MRRAPRRTATGLESRWYGRLRQSLANRRRGGRFPRAVRRVLAGLPRTAAVAGGAALSGAVLGRVVADRVHPAGLGQSVLVALLAATVAMAVCVGLVAWLDRGVVRAIRGRTGVA